MTTIKHRIPNKNVRKRIYQIYIYIICFIQGKENFQSDYFAIISRCERKKYLLPCQNMLIKSNSTRAKRRGKKIVYGEKPIDVNDLWSKKDRAHHTWTRRGRRQGIVALTHMTMYRVSRHAAFPCFAPFAFQNDVRVSFMCHSCGATSFSNSIPRYLQSSTYIYIYMCVPLTDVFETTSHDSPFAFSIRRNEHSCSLSCSWFTISLQPMLRKPFDRYLEPFVRSLVW